ncbi:MAG: tyrosine-type recombinase/integrase [Candidatus Saccharicenans sp.]|nr:tyrosine-type recombinase/integrase [Candidatus Saccharicenans sp.]
MRAEKNLKFIPGKMGERSYYVTDITLNYCRIRRFAGYTKEEARNFLAKLRLAAREGKLDDFLKPKQRVTTFDGYARDLLNSAEWKAKRSAFRNEISLNNLNKVFKDIPLGEINPALVRKYVTMRKELGILPATINREISLLKSILYSAEFDGLIDSNPIRGRRIKKLEENNNREKSILNLNLSEEDLVRLCERAAPHFRPILELAIITGMRRNEILKMKWKDIDFGLRVIRIPAENSKSKKERFIPISADLIRLLDSVEKKGDYVFMNDWTGKRRKRIEEAFRAACERAGILYGRPGGLTFHDLRHIAAYRLVKVTDVVTASKILGHSSLQMTMRYIHPTESDKREAIERVAESLFRGRQKDVNGQSAGHLEGLENKGQIN